MSQLANRYARAAWDVALETKVTAELLEDFTGFHRAYAEDASLRQALTNPAFESERAALLRAVLEAAKVRPVAAHLLQLLLEHERMPLLNDVEAALRAFTDEDAGNARASVRAAVELAPQQVARIEEVLTKRMGRPVVAEVQVDPSLVAGMVCRVGRLTFDSSLKKQLGQFAESAGASSAASSLST